jgi:hypothetical protein
MMDAKKISIIFVGILAELITLTAKLLPGIMVKLAKKIATEAKRALKLYYY